MQTLGANYLQVDTTPQYSLLDYTENRKGKFVYGQAQGALAVGDVVKIDNDGQLIPLTTTVSGAEPTACGISQVVMADNEYGWVWVKGGGAGSGIVCKVLTLAAAGAKLYTTATAGALDDAATDLVQGLTILTTAGGVTENEECYSPIEICTNCQD